MDRHLSGQTFGRWHVIGYAGKNNGYKVWMCKCDCGTMREVRESHLLDGRSKSCGCLIHDKPSWNYKGTPDRRRLNRIYGHMIRRCYDADSEQYERYGARGISVCDKWRESFDTFADWAYKNGYAHGLTIDRIDNSKGYSPENCIWVTIAEQQNNKTNNIVFSVDGERKTASQVAREARVKPATVHQWLRRGMSKEDVLNRLNAI